MKHKVNYLLRAGPVLVICLCALMLARPANATTVTLTDLNSTVDIDLDGGQGMYNWTVDGTDQLVQQWFWYRVGATGGESRIDQGTTMTYDPPSATHVEIYYTKANEYEIKIALTLMGGSTGSKWSDMAETIRVRNLKPSGSLDFHFFQYCDFDLDGSADDDTTWIEVEVPLDPHHAFQYDPDWIMSETTETPHADHGEVALTSTTLTNLNNASPTTLSDDLGPYGPGDYTWAFQWDVEIAYNGTWIISKDKQIRPWVPEPLTLLGMFLGLGSIGAYIRRRRMS